MKKALILIAKEGFRDEELFDTKEVLDNAGIKTTVASTETGTANGKLGGTAEVDVAVKDVDIAEYDALVLVGGPGAPELADHQEVLDLAIKAKELGKKIASICISPYILAKAGVITGKKATSFPAEPAISEFEKQGVIRVDEPLVIDGDLVTADGPKAAHDFGQAIVNMLK